MTHRRVWFFTSDGYFKLNTTNIHFYGLTWGLCGDNDSLSAPNNDPGSVARFSLGSELDLSPASLDYSTTALGSGNGSSYNHHAWRGIESVLTIHVDGDTATAVDQGVQDLTAWLHSRMGVPVTVSVSGQTVDSYSVGRDYSFAHNLFLLVEREDGSVRYLPISAQVVQATVRNATTQRRTMFVRIRAEHPFWWGPRLDVARYVWTGPATSVGSVALGDAFDALVLTGDVPSPANYLFTVASGGIGTNFALTNTVTGQYLHFDDLGAINQIEAHMHVANPSVVKYPYTPALYGDIWHLLSPGSGWWEDGGNRFTVATPYASGGSISRTLEVGWPRWFWTW